MVESELFYASSANIPAMILALQVVIAFIQLQKLSRVLLCYVEKRYSFAKTHKNNNFGVPASLKSRIYHIFVTIDSIAFRLAEHIHTPFYYVYPSIEEFPSLTSKDQATKVFRPAFAHFCQLRTQICAMDSQIPEFFTGVGIISVA